MQSADEKHPTGSCLCGTITYTVTGELRSIILCHCHQCRKTSGHYVAATSCQTDKLQIYGDSLMWYQSSEEAKRGFCRICGSNLFWQKRGEGRTSIFAGTLNGNTGLRIIRQLYTESKGDYYELPSVR